MKANAMFVFSLLFSTLVAVSCTKNEVSEDRPVPEETATTPVPTVLNKTLILQLVNDVRKKGCQCGETFYPAAGALTWNDLLEKAASGHSEDMYRNKYFSHTAPDGSNAGLRIERAGYSWMAYGENIGMGYKNEKEVVEAWTKSPGNCKNLMNARYKEMGVARVGSYWTQNFGAR